MAIADGINISNNQNYDIIINTQNSFNENGITQNIIVVDFSVKKLIAGKSNIANNSEDRSVKVSHHHENEQISKINTSNLNKFNITHNTVSSTLQASIAEKNNLNDSYQLNSAESINVKTFIDSVQSLSVSMAESDNQIQLGSRIKNEIKTISSETELKRLREYVENKLAVDGNDSLRNIQGKEVLIRKLIYRNVETLLQHSLKVQTATQELEDIKFSKPEISQQIDNLKQSVDQLINSNDLNTITDGANQLAKELTSIEDIDFLKKFKDYIEVKKADTKLEWIGYNLESTVLPVVLSKINASNIYQ
jgi:hypothetical protein